MANISLKKFVDVYIQPKITREIDSTRKEVVILTNEWDSSYSGGAPDYYEDLTIDNYKSILDSSIFGITYKYLEVYFKFGGIKATVVAGVNYTSSDINTALYGLEDKYIVAAFAYSDGNEENQPNYSTMLEVATLRNENVLIQGINEKILLARSNSYNDNTPCKNLAVKYTSVIGGEMTIAAYLSRINVYGINTIQDYAYTAEIGFTPQDDLDTNDFETLINNNYNVDIDLQGTVRNCGGNCKDGDSLINNYTRIILNQTLTERLINLVASKIKSSDGVSKIYAVIVDELEKYKNNGYLTTDKIWEADDLVIDGNLIISKGTAILSGYYVKVLPMNVLTPEDKRNHKAPPIYVIIADQYSIRVIEVRGEVI